MMNEMQQEAGDNSQQIQNKMENCIVVVNGIDEKRAREIFDEKILALQKELTEVAMNKAEERVRNFNNDLITRMKEIENSFEVLREPAFHFMLKEAQKTAARTEKPADYELLSELLLRRIEIGNNTNVKAGIKRAVEIVDEVSDESLTALTLSLAIIGCNPFSGSIFQGLDTLDDLFEKIFDRHLPNSADNEWIDNLEIVGAIRISQIGKLNTFETIYSNTMSGYCVAGIKKHSDNYKKAFEMLKKFQLPPSTLCINELNEEYMRLPIASENLIEKLQFTMTNQPLNEEQKKILHEIYSMYDNDNELLKSIQEIFNKEIEKRKNLKIAKDWWNNIPIVFNLTSVGRSLAYANLKRIDPQL